MKDIIFVIVYLIITFMLFYLLNSKFPDLLWLWSLLFIFLVTLLIVIVREK